MRLALIFVLCATPCFGQGVVQLQGGASSFSGDGGGLVIFGPNSETRFSAGFINDHFAYSAAENFSWRGWEVGVGDNQFSITGGQFYLSAPVRGISLIRKRPYACRNDVRVPAARVSIAGYTGQRCRGDSLYIFAGAVGQVRSSPFFFGIQQAHLGAGFGYKRELTRHLTVGTIQAWTRLKRTSLEEADFKTNHFEIKGQAGWLENNLQLSGNASAAWNHFGANAGRSTYVFNMQQPGFIVPVSRITVNNFGVFGGYSHFSGSASLFQSNLNTGRSLNLGTQWFGFLQVQASSYVSGKTSSKLLTITEHSMHWSLSQYITRSNQSTSYNFGASYVSNRWTAQVGYNVLYFPALPQAQAFQKVLSITLGFRFKSTSLSATTIVNPQAKNQWQIGGDDYTAVPGLRLPSVPGASADAHMLPSAGHGGKQIFEIQILDTDNQPVEGGCVTLDHDQLYSNSEGKISSRQKRKTATLIVNPENFMSGNYEVVGAPAQVTAGTPVKIIVRRK